MQRALWKKILAILTIIALSTPFHQIRAEDGATPKAKTVRDILWIWGNPEMAQGNDGDHTLASFAQASPARRAELLGTPNVIMAGPGIPNDQQLARAQTESVKRAPQIVWEILPDGDGKEYHDKFEYTQRAAQIQKLKADFPNIKAVLLDDMTSVAVDKGFKPEHLRTLKKQLSAGKHPVELWGVFYTMNFNRPNINDYINQLDVINLWTWHAKDVVDLEKNVAYCKQHFPGKPIVLGLYLRDYGAGRDMPRELLELQCETALKLAHQGQIAGMAFLTIDNDTEALAWTADWIGRVGGQKLGAR